MVAVLPSEWGWTATPVAGGDGVWIVGEVEHDDADLDLLQRVDLTGGAVAATVRFRRHDERAPSVVTSLPAVRPDGGVWLAVLEHEIGVTVIGVDRGGAVDARFELPSEYPLVAGDVGVKQMLRVAAGPDGGVLFSFTYRQVRVYGTRLLGADGATRWSVPDWLLAGDADLLVTCPPPERGAPAEPPGLARERAVLFGRDPRTGAARWQRAVEDVTVAGLHDGVLYLADRGARRQEARDRHLALDALYLAGAIGDDELKAGWEAIRPRLPTQVRALDAATGEDRWAIDAGAEVIGVVAVAAGVAILGRDDDGAIRLRLVSHRGEAIASAEVGRGPAPGTATPGHPALIAAGADAVVVLLDAGWVCLAVPDLELRAVRAEPVASFGFAPRIVDRDLTVADAVVVGDRLVIRAGDRLWIEPLPGAGVAAQ